MRRFEGRTALISGGGSGIGRAVASRFVGEGGRVAIIGRTPRKLEAVAAGLPDGSVLVLAGDHSDAEFAAGAVARTVELFGGIDLLFNNAGVYPAGGVAECRREVWEETLAINLTGPFLLTREALPVLRRQGRGVIINNASTLGLRPIPGRAAYCVSKAGLVMLTQAIALEEARNGIRANVLCPGVVDTPILDAASSRAELASLHPLGRIGTVEEVASAVLFLASDESRWTTGAVVTVDGGISLA